MNNLVNDIAKKGKDDFDSSEKLIVHFDEMIEMFVKAQSKIIDIIQSLNSRNLGVRDSKNKCIQACLTLKTKTCDKMSFIDGN